MMDINLCDVHTVEIGGGRVSKVIGLRTPARAVHVRTIGASALATQLAQLAEGAKKLPLRRR